MQSYRDKETTTIIATPLEISRILTDMLREESMRGLFGDKDKNPIIQTHYTQTKALGNSCVVFKLDTESK